MPARKVSEMRDKPVRRKRGRPRQDEVSGEALRTQVIARSRDVYARHGYHRTTVAMILSAANISRPTFYRLFTDRREVIDCIVSEANNRLRAAIFSAVADTAGPEQALIAAVDAYFAWCEEMGPLVGPVYSEINDPESPASTHRQAIISDFVALMHQMAERFGQPRFDPVFYDTLIRAVEHAGSSAYWPKRLSDQAVAMHRRVAAHVLMASLLPTAASSRIRDLQV